MTLFEALYERPCRSPSCWLDNKNSIIGSLKLIKEISKQFDLNKKRMKGAQNKQKSYVYLKMRSLEFKEGELIFLKISQIRGMMRLDKFRKCGKLRPRYIGLFEILKRVGEVTYKIDYKDLEI